MAQYTSEYSKPSVGNCSGGNCSGGYSRLGCYLGSNPTMPYLSAGTTVGAFLTPDYGSVGYDSLTYGGNSSCNSYVNIQDAYGGANLSNFSARLCNSCGGGGGGGGGRGSGTAWKCDKGQCKAAHPGTQGAVFRTKKECENSPSCSGWGKGSNGFRCDPEQGCVVFHPGTKNVNGEVFNNRQECVKKCPIR